jgi:hypothetical protein
VWHCGWNQEKENEPKVYMIGASMNCRGVGTKHMSIFLPDLLKDEELDFIGLKETIQLLLFQEY